MLAGMTHREFQPDWRQSIIALQRRAGKSR
jgi:hypothetical protein